MNVVRRGLLIRSVLIDGGLMLGLTLPGGRDENIADLVFSRNAFIRIDSDGEVVLNLPAIEGGQDSDTLAPLVAAELEVAPNQVHLDQVAPSEAPTSSMALGARAAGNSNDIRDVWKPLCEASATARAMLIAAAARRWDVDARFCQAHEGEVIHTITWRKLRYGQLSAEAARVPIPNNVALKEPASTVFRRA
jgi:isoquinoline 1-oxidoreductase subunit beta